MQAPPAGHGSAGQAVRAVTFIVLMYALLAAMGLVALPFAAMSRRAALGWCKRYCRSVLVLLRLLCRTRAEIRGPVPSGPCVVASKHQSFLDVIMLVEALPRPRFVMKQSLLWVPVLGYFARRIGCIAIDRSAGGEAVRTMLAGVGAWGDDAGQIVIFPQGTRVAPGLRMPYRAGVARLHAAFGLPVVMAAANTGWFWPRTGLRRSRGTAVVEFLGSVDPGLSGSAMLIEVERGIEAGSDRLAAEAAAGFADQRKAGR